jgi:metallo-beta-lactamase family protein
MDLSRGPTLGFYGGAGTVTGSRFFIDQSGRRLLVDCGMFQGLKELRLLNWEPTPFDPRSIDAVVLTHAHIDHSGYLPRLVRAGFRGPIYSTDATRDLANILLADAARIQEEDADFANRKGFSKHKPALPLFDTRDSEAALKLFSPKETGELFNAAGFEIQFHRAGHILGAAFAEIRASPAGGQHTFVFSGDLGRYDAPLQADPAALPECDTLVVESTYGDREHTETSLAEQIREPFARTLSRGGVVLIPAFAVARTQLILVLLKELMTAGLLATVPIHIDSPMASDVTSIYARYAPSELQVTRAQLFPHGVHFHRSVEESKELNRLKGPRIIIASSGMMTGGRVLHHLERLLPDLNNLLVLAGYQAAGTRGRKLLEGARFLRIHGRDVPVRTPFIQVEGLSAHADANDLDRWIGSGPRLPRQVFLVHGESGSLKAMSERLMRHGVSALVPALNERYRLLDVDKWEAISR